MLIELIIEFQLRGLGSLAVHVLLLLVIFMTKQKSLQGTSLSGLLFTAKILLEAMHLLPLPWPYHLQLKFNTKMQDFKRVVEKLQIKRGLNNLVFLIGFQMLKILFQIALNTC